MGWLIVIGFCVIVVGLIWWAAVSSKRDSDAGIIASFSGLKLSRTHVIEGGRDSAKRYPLDGASAFVEDAGQLSKRITATRALATGVVALAWRKRKDDRSIFLTIQGPGVALVREVRVEDNKDAPAEARAFAARVNATAAALGGPAPATDSTAGRDLGGQLADLAALRDSGALTEAEFTAAKARLLGGTQGGGPRGGGSPQW